MRKKEPKAAPAEQTEDRPYRMRLPGFIDEEIGLGDVVKRVTAAAGIKTCGGCQQRAAALNRWLVFSGGRRRS